MYVVLSSVSWCGYYCGYCCCCCCCGRHSSPLGVVDSFLPRSAITVRIDSGTKAVRWLGGIPAMTSLASGYWACVGVESK